jgi:lysozyme
MLTTEKKIQEPDLANLVVHLESADSEGFRSKVYDCGTGAEIDFSEICTGHPTIGIGWNLSNGITKELARVICRAQVEEIAEELYQYEWYRECSSARKEVLIEMAFNLGVGGLMNFKRMIQAIKLGQWDKAGAEIVASDAGRKLAARYNRLMEKWLKG